MWEGAEVIRVSVCASSKLVFFLSLATSFLCKGCRGLLTASPFLPAFVGMLESCHSFFSLLPGSHLYPYFSSQDCVSEWVEVALGSEERSQKSFSDQAPSENCCSVFPKLACCCPTCYNSLRSRGCFSPPGAGKEHPLSCGAQQEGQCLWQPPCPCSAARTALSLQPGSGAVHGSSLFHSLRPPSLMRRLGKSEQGQASSELGKHAFLLLPFSGRFVSCVNRRLLAFVHHKQPHFPPLNLRFWLGILGSLPLSASSY